MRYLLLGYYGFKNTGDEALAEVLVRELRRIDPAAAIRLASSRQNLFKTIADINWADLVIGGGGGLLQDSTSARTIPFYLGLLQLAKWRGKKALMLGQGLGPLKRFISRQLVRCFLPNLNGITFRDQASADLAQKICRGKKLVSSVTADLAFLLPTPGNNEKTWRLRDLNITAKPKIGLAIRFPAKSTKNDWARELAAFCDRAAADADICFLPFHYPDDVAAAKAIAAQMQKSAAVIDQVLKPAEMLGLLSAFDIVVGMRLHSLIFAVKAGVPAIGIAYDPKIAAFMDECGLPCLPIDTITKEKLQAEFIKLRGNIA
ncbi:MAG: polysaccharide pyruvyl transferase CsaB, partial [Candidatus Margulisiibacteriota bacterium]